MSVVEKAIEYAVDIASDDKHGYDQSKRWGNDYDCSSLVITAFSKAGTSVKKNGATYTGNMYTAFIKSGFKDVSRECNFARMSGLKRGDVLLAPHHHTALYIGGGQVVEAHCNEYGHARGGKTGDQTGKEISVNEYHNYPWAYCLRYDEHKTVTQAVVNEVIKGKYGNGEERKKKLAEDGYDYSEVQTAVNKKLKKGV